MTNWENNTITETHFTKLKVKENSVNLFKIPEWTQILNHSGLYEPVEEVYFKETAAFAQLKQGSALLLLHTFILCPFTNVASSLINTLCVKCKTYLRLDCMFFEIFQLSTQIFQLQLKLYFPRVQLFCLSTCILLFPTLHALNAIIASFLISCKYL